MIFLYSDRLWWLVAWGVLILWAVHAAWRRRRAWLALSRRGRPPREGAIWWLLAIVFLIGALAEPKWGRIGPPPAPGHDVVLLIDVSRSMGAEDAVPDRLGAAVEYGVKLVEALGEGLDNRAAVVAFAGRGALRCPLTENLGAVIDTLRRLRPGSVQPGGTDLGAGLDASLDAMGTDEHAGGQSIVVLSDGEDLAERWKSRADRLVRREVRVYAVTIGDAEQGHPVPSGTNDRRPLVYRGEPVASRRSDAALRTLAEQTKGLVIPLGLSTGNASVLYRKQIEPGARRHALAPRASEMAERFPLFLAASLSCVLAACWPPGRGGSWVRPRWPKWNWLRRRRERRGGAVATALAVLAIVLVSGSGPSRGRLESPRQIIERGRASYEANRFDRALAAFEEAILLSARSPIPRYDAAAALYRLERFEEAQARYAEARTLANDALRTKIDYAMGNTSLALGDVNGAIAAYDRCLASTVAGEGLDAVRRDAAINRAFAFERMAPPPFSQSAGADDPSTKPANGGRSPGRPPGGDESSEGLDEGPVPTAGGPAAGNPESRNRLHRRRRSGGGGGAGRDSAPGDPGSPEDRLDAALDDIRDAQQSRRLPDEPPPSSRGDGRDW